METRMNTPKVGTSTTINLPNNPEFKLTIGSENKKEPKVVYFFLSSWITSEEPITKEIVNKINKRIRQSLYDKNDLVFNRKRNIVITDFVDASNASYSCRKKHFMTIEVTMYQLNEESPLEWNNYNLQMGMLLYVDDIIKVLGDYGLSFHLNRK